MKSYYMNVSTTAKSAEIYVNDKKETELSSDKTSKEVGPYFPGSYVVKAKAKTELTELETEKKWTWQMKRGESGCDIIIRRKLCNHFF